MAAPAKIEKTNDEIRAALEVKKPSEIIDWINALIYGPPGAGKTFLVGTADELGPTLIFDVEGGVTTIRHRNVDVVPIRSMKELEDGFNKLFKSIDPVTKRLYYKVVGIDSLTELADLDMKTIMKGAFNANPDKVDIDVPSPREWGKTRNHIRTIVRAFRDLPCHVIYTAALGESQEEGQPRLFYPGFSGKLKTEVPGFMDIVGYLYPEIEPGSGVKTRKLQVAGTRRVVAKDRTSALGDVIENPTIPMIWDLIQNYNPNA